MHLRFAVFLLFLLCLSPCMVQAEEPMVRCGGSFAIARSSEGKLWGWGDGRKGQLGNGEKKIVRTPKELDWPLDRNIADIQCGNENTLILLTDGTVWTCGSNSYGQQAASKGSVQTTPVKITSLQHITQIATGFGHCLALTETGEVYAWGRGGNGQLGNGLKKNQSSPVLLELSHIVSIACGGKYSLCLDEYGQLYGFGDNEYGQLGKTGKNNVLSPLRLALFSEDISLTAIAAGGDTAYALGSDGTLYAWGRNDYYQTGVADRATKVYAPLQVSFPEGTVISSLHAYSGHTAIVTDRGALLQWGHVSCGVRGCSSSPFKGLPTVVSPEAGVLDMDNGSLFVCILMADGRVLTSGDNEYAQLGVRNYHPGVWADTGLNLFE